MTSLLRVASFGTSSAMPRAMAPSALRFARAMAATLIAIGACFGCSGDATAPEGEPFVPAPSDTSIAPARDAGASDGDGSTATHADAGSDATAIVPNVDAIPWTTGTSVGNGVAFKDTGNPAGDSSFVAYTGSNVSLASAKAWATALYKAWLQPHGVRYVWAVQGPAVVDYSGLEIGNDKVASSLVAHTGPNTKYILVAAHSAGSFVAHELLNHLAGTADPKGVTKGKVVYFSLDGGRRGAPDVTALSTATVARLRKAYFVVPYASKIDTYGIDTNSMQIMGSTYGGYFTVDANAAGCHAGANYCLHMTLVTTKPHDPDGAVAALDYGDFSGRPVTTAYLAKKAVEAGLSP